MIRLLGAAAAASAVSLAPLAILRAQQGPPPPTPPGWAGFVRTFDAGMDSDLVVGGAVDLVQDGRVIAHHERGLADRALGQPVDGRTLFHYGSITKSLTAISIMQLRDRGKLSLDDKITRWVPELHRMHDPYGMMDSITLRMLLSHSAGFQDPTWPYAKGQGFEPFEPTTWNQLVAMMPYQELHLRPGSRYSYSNPAFIYLARVIEQISGDPWETYVQKNIFAPLGLERSYFGATPYYIARDRSNNYTVRRDSMGRDTVIANGRDFNPGITIPNGGWNAPLSDLVTYLGFLTDAGGVDPARRKRYDVVLQRASLEEMWRPVVPITRAPHPKAWMGLSFFLYDRDGVSVIGHTGSQAGFLAFIYFNPATRTGIVAAWNTLDERRPRGQSGFGRVNDAAISFIAASGKRAPGRE